LSIGAENLGKKLKCPACSTIFKSQAPEQVATAVIEEPAPAKKPKKKPRQEEESDDPFGFSNDDGDSPTNEMDFSGPETRQSEDRRAYHAKVGLAVWLLRAVSVAFMIHAVLTGIAFLSAGGIGGAFAMAGVSAFLLSAAYSLKYGRGFYRVLCACLVCFVAGLPALAACGVLVLMCLKQPHPIFIALAVVSGLFTAVYLGAGLWSMLITLRHRADFKS
jgi:hypothetical protein